MTKIRVMLDGGDYCDVAADLLTFDDDAVVLWAKEAEIGRYSRPRVTALDLSVAGSETRSRSAAAQERLDEIRRAYPNAYLPWTPEQEEVLAARHAEGATVAELAEELGRQPGGIEARLEKLELIEADESTTRRRRAS
jgi:DNA-directed RNA polymerase specialized sigma24 family protein